MVIGAMSWLSSIFGSVLNGWSLDRCHGCLHYLRAFLLGGHWGYVLAFFNIWERYYWVVIGAMSWLSSIFGNVLNGWSLGLCPGFLHYILGAFLLGCHWVMSWLSAIFGSVLNGWSLELCPGFLQYLGAFLLGGHWSDVLAVCNIRKRYYWVIIVAGWSLERKASRALRSSDVKRLIVPARNLKSAGERAFSFAAPSLWNSLPVSLRYLPTLAEFKSQLKTYLYWQFLE